MVRIVCIGSLVLAAVTAVSGHVIPRHKFIPKGWNKDLLEPYRVYNERYLAWGCKTHHNTTFFDKCCHPLLKNECIDVLEDRGCPPPPSPGASTSYPPASPLPPSTTAPPEQSNPAPVPVKPTSTEPAHTNPPTVESTTTHTEPSSTHTTTPSPAPTNGGDFNLGGQATFFLQKGNAGACGTVHSDNDLVAAMDQRRYGNAGNKSPLCGRQVEIINMDDPSRSVIVIVADDCPTCNDANSIDLSQAAFEQLGKLSRGVISIKWRFLS